MQCLLAEMMSRQESWTLCSLMGSYLDLALAYLFLYISTLVFFASKLLVLFGVALPPSDHEETLCSLVGSYLDLALHYLFLCASTLAFLASKFGIMLPPSDEEMMKSSNDCDGSVSPKPGWMQLGPDDSIISDFDPEILAAFRDALEEFSPLHPTLDRSHEPPEKVETDARRASPPGGKGMVVLYFTSLRGIRKTYDDCSAVRVILQGYGVRIDERDVSMHGAFKEELKEIFGIGHDFGRLPRVFADGKYLGGADDVRQMHEVGEIGTALEGCEMAMVGKVEVCGGCGGVRFVLCETCSGSCKVYMEKEEEEEEDEGGFQQCPDCNENGLVRCPLCC